MYGDATLVISLPIFGFWAEIDAPCRRGHDELCAIGVTLKIKLENEKKISDERVFHAICIPVSRKRSICFPSYLTLWFYSTRGPPNKAVSLYKAISRYKAVQIAWRYWGTALQYS